MVELILQEGLGQARIICPENLIPAPGQYLLVGDDGSDSPLPVSVFSTDFTRNGFIAAAPIPDSWNPGRELYLRGPLGKGFSLPGSARRIGLVALEDSPSRLRRLIEPALQQAASVVLVSDLSVDYLPDEVEVQPLSALSEIIEWADYIAVDAAQESLPALRGQLSGRKPASVSPDVQVLVRTYIPCGGIAECGVCAVIVKSGWKMACKDGPVFDWRELV